MNAEYMLTAPRVTDTFFGAGITITSADILTSVKHEESVNAGDDLSFGGCVIPTVDIEMRDPGNSVADITGKSFVWYKNILTEKFSEKKLAVSTRVKLVAWNPKDSIVSNLAYVVTSTSPFVSIYNTDSMSVIKTVPDFDAITAPESLVVDGFTMYALYSKEPYVAKYSLGLNGDNPVLQDTPSLSAYNIEQVKEMCKNKICICRSASGGFAETYIERKNERPIAVAGAVYTEHNMGYYTADKPEKVNGGRIKVHCNGWLARFDVAVDEFVDAIEYPVSLKTLVQMLCNKVGVGLASGEFPNQDYPIQRNFVSTGLSGLQLLRWAVELAGSFARLNGDGDLELGWYEPIDVTIDKSAYMSITTGEYETLPIDRFQIRVVEKDIGVMVPPNTPGENSYVIQDNPLAYTETDAELRPAVEALYERVEDLTYRPFELKTFQNPYIKAGSVINVTTPKGETFVGYVMSKSTSGGMDTLTATGNQKRELQAGDSIHQVVKQVRGSIHELEMTVDGLRSTVESFGGDWVTTTVFETTVNGINMEVSKKLGEEEFSTKLRVSSDDVQIAWNAIDKTIQFVDGSLQIHDTSLPEGERLMVKFDDTASHYYYKGNEVGRIGTDSFTSSDDHRGIVFQLQSDSAYMTWSVQSDDDPEIYSSRMLYVNRPEEMGYPEEGVYIGRLYIGTKGSMLGFTGVSGGGGIVFDGENSRSGLGPVTSLGGVAMFTKADSAWKYYALFSSTGIDFYTSLDMHDKNIYNESDSRLKTNISETDEISVYKILKMDFKQFDWIESGNHEELGLIAQQVQQFFPEAVKVNEETGVMSLNSTKLVMYALKAIQELAQTMDLPMPYDNRGAWEDTDSIEDKMAFIDALPPKGIETSDSSEVEVVKGI